jgi:uncharacterized membrane protein (DUF106 family)
MIYSDYILPVLRVLYVPLDWILGWASYLPLVAAIIVVGLLSGLAIVLIQKYGSRQEFLGRCKADLKKLKADLKAAKSAGDAARLARARALSGRISGKYMGQSLKPALWTVPAITIVALWTGARLGAQPVRPGETIEAVAYFEDGASGFAHVVPADGLEFVGPAICAVAVPKGEPGKQARWNVKAAREGRYTLAVRHGGQTYPVDLPVSARGGRPPDAVTLFVEETPAQDRLQAVELKLAPAMKPAWWNVWFEWAGLYILVAVLSALGLRWLLGVH